MSEIKTWQERCEEHPDHQSGMVTHAMIQARMQEEIDDLRAEVLEQCRLNGAGGSRELRLLAERDRLAGEVAEKVRWQEDVVRMCARRDRRIADLKADLAAAHRLAMLGEPRYLPEDLKDPQP